MRIGPRFPWEESACIDFAGCGGANKPDRAGGAKHMRGVELARPRLAPQLGGQVRGILFGEFARHTRGRFWIETQIQDPLAQSGIGDMRAPLMEGYGGSLRAQAVRWPVPTHHIKPGSLDELEQA
jgi:hypothetical protein